MQMDDCAKDVVGREERRERALVPSASHLIQPNRSDVMLNPCDVDRGRKIWPSEKRWRRGQSKTRLNATTVGEGPSSM